MKKNYPLYDNENEIDLIALFKIFWNGKIKILLITIISFLVGSVYSSQIPINYLNSLTINPNKNSEFIKYDYMQKLLKINKSNQSNQLNQLNQLNLSSQSDQSNQLNLFRFINELKFNIEDQEMELFKNAKLLEIVKLNENEESYIINFKWHDPDEAKKVLQDILNLTSKNLKRSIDLELLQLLEFEKRLLLSKNLNRLDYLKEQSAIARELNIIDNQIDSVNLSQAAVSLNISTADTADIAYYLRGYRAIDKEIELIQNRESQNLKFIEQEINDFKDTEIEFVKYNIYSMKSNSLKNTKPILATSILLGLIVGIFYVLISNALQSQTLSKKTK